MKRLTSFLMVCIMLLGMSAGAFAAGDENASVEGGYTAVTTSNERVRGFYNDNAALKVELAGRYNSGAMSADGGSLEIIVSEHFFKSYFRIRKICRFFASPYFRLN